jgi:DNA-binding NtrC family response regulator
MKRIMLLAFPDAHAAELQVQFGRMAAQMPVESYPHVPDASTALDEDTLIFLWDSPVAIGQAQRLFNRLPQANLIILSGHADADRASDLMRTGAMDYRVFPCPDEILGIYMRSAEHRTALSQQAKDLQTHCEDFVTRDVETRRLLDQVALVAPSKASVFVIGESGTGKERLARYIHQCSGRKDAAFVAINCAAIPEGMLEAELFGYEKGAFTGAATARPGRFELAHGGTLLLDEVTEMPVHLQAKLLRVLQEEEVDRLGGRSPVKIDVRIIATSNRNLMEAIADGQFRQDLYYRLNVVNVQLPPLCRRPDDALPLAEHFLARFSAMYGKPSPALTTEAVDAMKAHRWPGNARELENCMHRAFLTAVDGRIGATHLGITPAPPSAATADGTDGAEEISAGMSIRDMERALIEKTLMHVRDNRQEAAKLLGISIRTLRNKLREYESGTGIANSTVTA